MDAPLTEHPVCCDLEMAKVFEGAEAAACRAFCTAAAEVHPDLGIRVLEGAGGVGLLYGPGDPLNSVKGAGLTADFDQTEWDALEHAFRQNRSAVVIDLCPLAIGTFVSMLSSRGYRMASFETVTFRSMSGNLAEPGRDPAIQIQTVRNEPAAVANWSRVLDVGFADGGEPVKFAVDFGRVRARMAAQESPQRTFMLLATVNGVPAGGAALSIARATPDAPLVAFMSGAAVLPGFRRRGIQSALTAARLQTARSRGCEFATITVRAGTSSHRNACRAGFEVAYTRPQVVRDVAAS